MRYISKKYRKAFLLAGFVSMLLCGVSDCLMSFMGEGGDYIVDGMQTMNIKDVPAWYYGISFVIGIFASAGYFLGTSSVCSYVSDRLGGKSSKAYKAYSFGTVMMSLGIFGIHTICALALMNIRAAVLAGLSAESIRENFVPSAIYPFIVGTTWQTTADIISGTAFIILVCKGVINIRKAWIAIGPLCFFVICQMLGKGLTALTGDMIFRHIFAGGESWGIAFMLLSVACICNGDADRACLPQHSDRQDAVHQGRA